MGHISTEYIAFLSQSAGVSRSSGSSESTSGGYQGGFVKKSVGHHVISECLDGLRQELA